MNNYGFFIKKVSVIGKNVKNATVQFKKGLNIISGPSDTGKSYIFNCINYMLGASKEPKKIDEAKDYSAVLMEIELYSGKTYLLKRDFKTQTVDVFPIKLSLIDESEAINLNIKHDKEKTDNLSAFLLEKSGYSHPIYVKTNQKGKIRTLSFRDFPLYINIGETKIIKENSPILSGQYSTSTVEKSIFTFLVSGIANSNNNDIGQNDSTLSKNKLEGQKELVERLIAKEEIKFEKINLIETLPENNLSVLLSEIQVELETINKEIEQKTMDRRNLWNKIEENKSQIISDSELIKRFKLLKDYYHSDLKRLNFVIEGDYYFSQLNFSKCPFCHQKIDKKSCTEHNCGFNKPSNELISSVEVEIRKIKGKLSDLESTIEQEENDYRILLKEIANQQEKYKLVKEELVSILQPKQLDLKELLNTYVNHREKYIEYHTIEKKIDELKSEKKIIISQLKNKSQVKININAEKDIIELNSIMDFCEYFSSILKRWKFSESPKVLYEKGEFYVDSKSTHDYGKGYRAIIYSGFAIALMQFCKSNGLPHPGFVVIDSPLTTYKGKRSLNEEVSEDIQSAFFSDLSSLNNDMQIILLDNKEPSEIVKEKINYLEFTRDIISGRYGFFPIK
ncbi:AAA family ATPase [Sporolactobacillus sp. STCC-11]|uniref:AAA family ATPase n=1 Tax=Sporolactobacillus caesalpiniae TaxID=3230362 RepID=UPI00339873EF